MVFIVESCSKPIDDPGKNDPPGNGEGPSLPATPYDYVNGTAGMPVYLRNYLDNHPGVDNMPAGNAVTNHGATLGRVLFYDKSLSANNTISCASCHHQDKAFTDGEAFSKGFAGGLTRRNSMPVVNLRFFKAKKMFWNLRAADLETQVLMPIQDHIEMGIPSLGALETKLRGITYYPALFNAAFGTTDINSDRISQALAQFLRSITSFNSKYDQGLATNLANFTAQEKAGLVVLQRLNCVECHSDLSTVFPRQNPTFFIADNSGENTGNGSNNALDENYADKGIGELTGLAKDQGTFKIPTLRNIDLTAPYMHDGRFKTLEEVMEHYRVGAKAHPNRGIQIPNGGYKGSLTETDKANAIAFLKTLTDQSLFIDPKFSNPFQ
ncbi:cytochrome-c peroxidase [Paraflavitalea soli]|uniref:Cytochrome-c peroxidase n=2 Tax=Paraflavitalea soli TaxID=2315862 RepID=A0A3B7MVY2_9BACT|nr:cytochrome-c peroxidase [Paraflavitalea soli]